MFTLDANVQYNFFTKHFLQILDANAKQTHSTIRTSMDFLSIKTENKSSNY